MSSDQLKIALVQMTSVDSVTLNVEQMLRLGAEVLKSDSSVRLICFPENCLYMRIKEGESIPGFSLEDSVFFELGQWAKKHRVALHLGSVPLHLGGELFNSSVRIDQNGSVQAGYQKMHLFDIQLEGQKPIRESDVFKHGSQTSIFEVDGWRIGETICYDLRFAELFLRYAHKEIDVILVPAAFLVKTGMAHWELLLRARAVESQTYVLASAQGGTHQGIQGGERQTFGHTMAVEPWGEVMQQMGQREIGYVICLLDKARLNQVRAQIPMKAHRRLTVS